MCGARGTVTEPVLERPAYVNVHGVRASEEPCGLPRIAHEQGPLAHQAAKPRLVTLDEADLARWRRPTSLSAARISGPGPKRLAQGRHRAAKSADATAALQVADVRVQVPAVLLERLGYRGRTEIVTDRARQVLRTNGEHPWPLLVVSPRETLVELAPTRESLALLRAQPSQRAQLSRARRGVASRLNAALARAAAANDPEQRLRIMTDALQSAVDRLEAAERTPMRRKAKPRLRAPIVAVPGGLPSLGYR